MRQGTNPILLKTVRFFKFIPPFFLNMDRVIFKKKRRDKFPIIFHFDPKKWFYSNLSDFK